MPVVAELQVHDRAAVGDRHGGIGAQLHVRDREIVVGALDGLQEGEERGRIERAGNLAGAAADLVLHVAVHIGRGGQEAGLRGAGADHIVIREDIARIQNGAVDFGARELDIADAVRGRVPVARGTGAQQIAVEGIPQGLSGQRRPGDRDGNVDLRRRGGSLPEGTGLRRIKGDADDLVYDLKAAVIRKGGVLRLFHQVGVDPVKIGTDQLIGQTGEADARLAELKGADDGGLQGFLVQMQLAPALLHDEHTVFVIGHIFRLTQGGCDVGLVLSDQGVEIVIIDVLLRQDELGRAGTAFQPGEEVFKKVALPPVGINPVCRVLGGHDQPALQRVDRKALPGKRRHRQRGRDPCIPAGGVQGGDSLGFRQAAELEPVQGQIRIVGIQLRDAEGAEEAAGRDQNQQDQEDGENNQELFHRKPPEYKSI